MARDNAFEVIINRGSRDGVENGFRYVVFAKGPDIFDVETDEHLGTFDDVKGTGIVFHVDEKFSVLRSQERKRVPRPLDEIEKRVLQNAYAVGSFGASALGRQQREMIFEDAPFKNPLRGDFAKRV